MDIWEDSGVWSDLLLCIIEWAVWKVFLWFPPKAHTRTSFSGAGISSSKSGGGSGVKKSPVKSSPTTQSRTSSKNLNSTTTNKSNSKSS